MSRSCARAFVGKAQGVADDALAAEDQEIGRRWSAGRCPQREGHSPRLSVTNVRLEASSRGTSRETGPRNSSGRGSGHPAVIEVIGERQPAAAPGLAARTASPSRTTTELSSTKTWRIRSCSTIPA